MTVDAVAIAEEGGRRRVVGEGVHDRLGRPGGHPDEERAQARGGDREEIEGAQVRTWLARKLRQVWDGGVCRMLGLECLAARSRLFQNGRGLGPAKASGARHRPTPRRREHGRARG